MNPKSALLILLLSFVSISFAEAAGGPVDEDYTPLISLSNNMLELAKQSNANDLVKKMDEAMNIATELSLRNNSMTLGRFYCPKLRIAKKAAKAGKFAESIDAIEQSKAVLLQKKAPLTWDGGS